MIVGYLSSIEQSNLERSGRATITAQPRADGAVGVALLRDDLVAVEVSQIVAMLADLAKALGIELPVEVMARVTPDPSRACARAFGGDGE